MSVKILSVCLSLGVIGFVLDLVRREKLTFKYAFGWLLVGSAGLFFAIFDKGLFQIAYKLGFELPSNFIFFSCFFAVVILSLVLTIFLCQQNRRNDKIVQKMGLLENQVEELKKKIS